MTNYSIFIVPYAEENLLDIAEYIALDNPQRAMSYIDEIKQVLTKTLSIFPKSGKIQEGLDFSEEIRMYPYENYNCYYRVIEESKRVEVLFIYNANRDIQALLQFH